MLKMFDLKLVPLLFLLLGLCSGNFWKRKNQTNAQIFAKYQVVPAPAVTAQKLMTNLLRIGGNGGRGKRQTYIEDLVVVLDGSSSIGSDCEFNKGKQALFNMLAVATSNMKYAAVTYSNSAKVNFKFLTRTQAGAKLLNIAFPGGSTNTQAGLDEARKLFESAPSASGRRPNAYKVVLLVTDGQSNVDKHKTIPKANYLKYAIGADVNVIVIGNYIPGIDELVKVAGRAFVPEPDDYIFRVSNYNGFLEVVKLILKKVAPNKYKVVKGQFTQPC